MFNADCHVGVVYLIMCKPTTLLHATLYDLFLSVLYVTQPGRLLLPVRALVRVCYDEQSTRSVAVVFVQALLQYYT